MKINGNHVLFFLLRLLEESVESGLEEGGFGGWNVEAFCERGPALHSGPDFFDDGFGPLLWEEV